MIALGEREVSASQSVEMRKLGSSAGVISGAKASVADGGSTPPARDS